MHVVASSDYWRDRGAWVSGEALMSTLKPNSNWLTNATELSVGSYSLSIFGPVFSHSTKSNANPLPDGIPAETFLEFFSELKSFSRNAITLTSHHSRALLTKARLFWKEDHNFGDLTQPHS